MKTYKTKIKRLWHGNASLRNYFVENCIKKQRDIEITCGKEKMTIKWQDLDKGIRNKEWFHSQHRNQIYCLIDFKWIPEQEKQQTLLTT